MVRTERSDYAAVPPVGRSAPERTPGRKINRSSTGKTANDCALAASTLTALDPGSGRVVARRREPLERSSVFWVMDAASRADAIGRGSVAPAERANAFSRGSSGAAPIGSVRNMPRRRQCRLHYRNATEHPQGGHHEGFSGPREGV